MTKTFTIYPAIDLRHGNVVRLSQGDPNRQTTYGNDPASAARRWTDAGTPWLHVVNLDGAFGDGGNENQEALRAVLAEVGDSVQVQFGGGLRSMTDIAKAIEIGVSRVILGTVAVENPELVAEAIATFGAEKIVIGIDARDGKVRTKGWVEESADSPLELALRLKALGAQTIIFTDIANDGLGTGVNVPATQALADGSGMEIIGSGGIKTMDDIMDVKNAGLAGVIVGRALYEGQIDLAEAIANVS